MMSSIVAQENENALSAAPPAAKLVVAAKVDGEAIYVREVQRRVRRVIGDRPVDPEGLRILQAQALEQLINRRIILNYLQRKKLGPSDQDILLSIERAKDRLKQQETTLDQFLQRSGQTEAEFRRAIQWQLGWERYLARYLTEENLRNYFQQHHRQFDGTELRVAQILWRVESADQQPPNEPRSQDDIQLSIQRAIQQAQEVRDSITSGAITFERAVRAHSTAPSRAQGGDLGFIARHHPMAESFSQAAFELDVGELSQPVVSPHGVHLIKCLEVKPGQKRFDDVRPQVRLAVIQYLFDWVVQQQHDQTTIRYTGKSPHFEPGSRRLAS